jgi:hypothetical protein
VGQFQNSAERLGNFPEKPKHPEAYQDRDKQADPEKSLLTCRLLYIYLTAGLPLRAEQSNYFVDAPDVILNASFHRRRHPQRPMHQAEVIVHEV